MKRIILLTNVYSGQPLEIISELIPPNFNLWMSDSYDDLKHKATDADYLLVIGRMRIPWDGIRIEHE